MPSRNLQYSEKFPSGNKVPLLRLRSTTSVFSLQNWLQPIHWGRGVVMLLYMLNDVRSHISERNTDIAGGDQIITVIRLNELLKLQRESLSLSRFTACITIFYIQCYINITRNILII